MMLADDINNDKDNDDVNDDVQKKYNFKDDDIKHDADVLRVTMLMIRIMRMLRMKCKG